MRTAARLPLAVTALASALALSACGAGRTPGTASAAGEVGSASSTTSVTTAFGEVEVPTDPQRVVALGDTALDTALALGVQPVGTLASRGGDGVSPYLAEQAGDVEIVGAVREPNVEAVLGTAPDLILAASGTEQAQYDALSAIAPTVVPEAPPFGAWEQDALVFGAALGRADEVEQLLADLEARTAAVRAEVEDPGTAAVVRWMPSGPIVMSSGLMTGRLVEAVGDDLPAIADFSDKPHTDPLSLENLSAVDADVLYVATLDADGEEALEAAQASPAFARLQAARSGRVVVVDGGTWTSAAGPLAAAAVLDDLERVRAAG